LCAPHHVAIITGELEEIMRKWIVGAFVGATLFGASAAEAQAPRPERVHVAPYAGYMVFGNLVDGPLGTSLRTADAPLYGAQLGLAITPGLSLIGNVAHSSTAIEAGMPILGGLELADSKVWLYDAGLQLGFARAGSATAPFVQVGAGAMRHSISVGPIQTNATNFALNAGVGVDVQVSPNVAMRLMAKDYYGKFDFEEAALFDIGTDATHNFALSAGLKIGF
ncbi:MAG TPA: outer membrane beta-barrel protein, partial [Gemmatimonadaceae bacterium]|nr:outer membrane beta-barrel protein [Gemmatimonadaceae bacterium]